MSKKGDMVLDKAHICAECGSKMTRYLVFRTTDGEEVFVVTGQAGAIEERFSCYSCAVQKELRRDVLDG